MIEIKKTCKKHGELAHENIYRESNKLRCRLCKREKDERYREKNRKELVARNMVYKQFNRDKVNAWAKQDRINNPEKYRKYESNYIKKHGIEKIRKYEVARIHGLTIEQYENLIESQNNKCLICNNPETRIGRDGKTLTLLCIDHCHFCEEKGKYIIRGLLCHDCNTGIGKFKDDINLIKSAIIYLESHNHF